jgi:hypothetical protein
MKRNFVFIFVIIVAFATIAFGQSPGGGGRRGIGGPPRAEGPPRGDWTKAFDTNKDGSIDRTEFQVAIDATFAELDKGGKGVNEADELRPPGPPADGSPRPDGQMGRPVGPAMAPRAEGAEQRKMLPPFFFREAMQPGQTVTKAQLEQIAKGVFGVMDKNHDGLLSREESRPPRPEGPGARPEGPPQAPPPPNAQFIGAELRFGDKLVVNKPFSADIVIQDNRRLFDGTIVTKEVNGAVYRDGAGRTRREQPLGSVGGVNLLGSDNKPQKMVFINDFGTKTQYFLDLNNKVAHRHSIDAMRTPIAENDGPPDAVSESLGQKTIEGVAVEGTRTTFQIPAGQLGNASPIEVTTERWYSPDLQLVVMTRHIDPLAGEHIFKLVNIRQAEPAVELFVVPAGYKVEEGRAPRPVRPE